MTQYNTLSVKFSNSQLNKLKSRTKNRTKVTLNLSSNLIKNSNDETYFPYKILLTDTQVSKIWEVFTNGSSANIKFSKTYLSKTIQSRGILEVLLVALPYGILEAGTQELIKKEPEITRDVTKYFVKKGIKINTLSEGPGITPKQWNKRYYESN